MLVADEFIKTEGWWLEHYLGLWASWMRSKGDELPEGCPNEASGGAQNYTSLTDFDGMCERMDTEHAQQVHIAVHRLPDAWRAAIYCERGLGDWSTDRTTQFFRYEAVLGRAKIALTGELRRLGLWFGE